MNKRNRIIGIIPARYGSSRYPGKPLADLNGKSMIERVYLQSKKSNLLDEVVVATDDERIENAVRKFGGKVVMTSAAHQSGTDRCVEALGKVKGDWDVAINIQGDEPLIFPEQINQVAGCFNASRTSIATLVKVISREEELFNPNVVKVVTDQQNRALYFSRAALPFNRGEGNERWISGHEYYKHVGIYGYRVETLKEIAALPQSSLELAESLEQLRWLQNGYTIATAVTTYDNFAVDTPADLDMVLKLLMSSEA